MAHCIIIVAEITIVEARPRTFSGLTVRTPVVEGKDFRKYVAKEHRNSGISTADIPCTRGAMDWQPGITGERSPAVAQNDRRDWESPT